MSVDFQAIEIGCAAGRVCVNSEGGQRSVVFRLRWSVEWCFSVGKGFAFRRNTIQKWPKYEEKRSEIHFFHCEKSEVKRFVTVAKLDVFPYFRPILYFQSLH